MNVNTAASVQGGGISKITNKILIFMAASAWQRLFDCVWPMRRKGYSYYSEWPFKSGILSAYHITIYNINNPLHPIHNCFFLAQSGRYFNINTVGEIQDNTVQIYYHITFPFIKRVSCNFTYTLHRCIFM